jgi:hypothetical protein
LIAIGAVLSGQTPFLEAERQSVRAFSLVYSNIKGRKIDREIEGHIDNCLCDLTRLGWIEKFQKGKA